MIGKAVPKVERGLWTRLHPSAPNPPVRSRFHRTESTCFHRFAFHGALGW